MRQVRGHLQLAVLFFIALLAGAWTFVEPWVIGYPGAAGGGWSGSTWSNIWIGAAVMAASGLGLLVTMALAVATTAGMGGASADETGEES
jgi:hypothetical protein